MTNLKRLSVVVLICIVQKVYCLHLMVTPSHIEPGTTKNLIVNCSLDVKSTRHLAQLNSLVMSRSLDENSSDNHVVSSINSADGSVKVYTGDGVGSGFINNKGVSYLSVQWAFPFPDLAGQYICEAHGLALSMLPKTLVISTNVSSRGLSLNLLSQQLRKSLLQNSEKSVEINQLNDSVKARQEDVKTLQVNVTKSSEFIDEMKQENLVSLKTLFFESPPYKGHKYYLTRQNVLFSSTSAQATCVKHGGYLAEIDDEGEFHFVRSFLNNHKFFLVIYFAGTDEGHEEYWVYPRKNIEMTVDKFYRSSKHNEPDGGIGENCISFWRDADWYYADVPCVQNNFDYMAGYLCEIDKK